MMRKRTYIASMFIVFAFVLTGFGIQDTSGYKEVKIGTQVWMVGNLNVDKFRNGDPIPEAKTAEEWKIAGERGQPAWCYYDNKKKNGKRYGKLYNWYAVIDSRGLAPQGWHIPNNAEWDTLVSYLGGDSIAGGKMKSITGWYNSGCGTNESGFNGLPGGGRACKGLFLHLSSYANWWSSTERGLVAYSPPSEKDAWYCVLNYSNGVAFRSYTPKCGGHSVRCVRD